MAPPQAYKTAEMPLVPSRPHSTILGDLEDQSSLLIVPWRLIAVGQRLRVEAHRLQQLSISIGQTVSNLQEAETNAMFTLVHAMSPSSIKSVIQGTVAYDTAQGTTTWHDAPSVGGVRTPGVYVVALQSQPDGRFLSKDEILRVVDGIEDYITGCEVLRDKPAAANRNSGEKVKVRWVEAVDAAYSANKRKFSAARPKFNRDLDNLSGLRATAAMLRRRCVDGVSDTVRQKQSPIYTGCSQNLSVRMGDYSLDRHLVNVNKALGITLSVAKLKRLPLTPIVRVAIRTWRNEDLALAEQLVLSLADGFIIHGGFNKKEGGRNPPDNTPQEVTRAERLAIVKSPTFHTNVRASIDEIDSRGRFSVLLSRTAKHIEALHGRLTALDAAVQQAKPDLEKAGAPVDIEQLLADLTALRDHKVDKLRCLKNQERTAEALLAALGVGGAPASQQDEVMEKSSSEQDEGIC